MRYARSISPHTSTPVCVTSSPPNIERGYIYIYRGFQFGLPVWDTEDADIKSHPSAETLQNCRTIPSFIKLGGVGQNIALLALRADRNFTCVISAFRCRIHLHRFPNPLQIL